MAHLTIPHPSSMLLCGPSHCGKTTWIRRLLQNLDNMFDTPIEKVVYCYSQMQSAYEDMQNLPINIDFIEGFPQDLPEMMQSDKACLLIVDDLMNETRNSTLLANYFTKFSHHNNVSIVLLNQSLFPKGKEMRTVSLNAGFIVCFKHARDQSQIMHLARQIFPGQTHYLLESFRDATTMPYGYLLMDFKATTPENMRLRTNVFPDDEVHYVYAKRV